METTTKPKHIGRNISRIRELRQMKQEALAQAIGVSQQTISTIENSETVDEDKLQQIAEALGVTAEVIKNFSEDAVLNIINNTFNTNDNGIAILKTEIYQPNFNPIDKIVELYERLLEAEKEKNVLLEQLKK
ncbi:helix-turn-helix transcriptional regulator [Flavobacterium cheonhonense]|uniref:Helix-turn-helix transcriptional regulator n=1 Tax=Flavobacterium cheonhonense TaxID=706185 RepID=A0ABP7TYR3_9FLAO|nr:helix-turn-helix transcriptional regulator [Flavobacterium cheonhonense]